MADVIERVEVLVSSPSRNYVTLRLTTRDGLVGLGDATVNGRECRWRPICATTSARC